MHCSWTRDMNDGCGTRIIVDARPDSAYTSNAFGRLDNGFSSLVSRRHSFQILHKSSR